MNRPSSWERKKKEDALKLTKIGREKLNNSTQHRVDSKTIVLKPKK